MEGQLFSIINAESSEEIIKKAMRKVNLSKLLKLARQEATQHSDKVIQVLRCIFQYGDCIENDVVNAHFATYQFCLSLLQQVEIPSSAVSELVGILLLETEKLSAPNLVLLSTSFLDSIKDGDMFDKWIVIFPKILSTLSLQPTVAHGQDDYTGKEFKSHLINSLLNARWQTSSSIHLVTVLRDVSLDEDELSRAIAKVFKILADLDVNELPPLLFQLLQLCSKGQRSQVLKGIISFFNKKNAYLEERNDPNSYNSELETDKIENFDTVKATEGTVILHISFAAKQDQDLGKEFIKILKANKFNSEFILSPFCLALALAVAKIQGFEEQILDVIKSSILRSFQEQEKKQGSLWIRELFISSSNAHHKVISTVHYSTFGWDHICESLVMLGLNLVESFGSKGGRSRDDFSSEKSCKLGQDILVETFKVHASIQPIMLEQILDRIICRDVDSVANYTGVLSAMVEHSPTVFLAGCLNKVQESIYCLPYMNHDTALGLLRALMPLLKVSLTLRDALMFTLRKALFNRELEARKVAISGHLLILKNFRVLGGSAPYSQSQNSQCSSISLSQVLVDVHVARHNKGANEALCLELLTTLQKTLTQQSEARQLLYQSIHHVLRKNPSMSGAVLELLFNQFQRYYEWSEDVRPPLKLETCVQIKMDEPVLVEPLSSLLHATQLCLCLAEKKATQDEFFNEEMESPHGVFAKLSSAIKTLVKRMIDTDLEDFELDKTSDFSNSSVGLKNQLYAEQLLGIYEALMEYSFRSGEKKPENCKNMLALFTKYNSLSKVFKEKCGTEKKAVGKKAGEGKKTSEGGKKGSGKKGGKNAKKDEENEEENEEPREEAKTQKKAGKEKRGKVKQVPSLLSLDVLSKLLWNLFCNTSIEDLDCFEQLRNDEEFVCYLVNTSALTVTWYKEMAKTLHHEADKNATNMGLIARSLIKHYVAVCDGVGGGTQTQTRGKTNRGQHIPVGLECLAQIVNLYCKLHPQHLRSFVFALKTGEPSSTNKSCQDTLRAIIKKFQKMMSSILSRSDDSNLRDVVPVLTVIQDLSEQLTEGFDQDLYKWTVHLCRQQNINDTQVARALLCLSFDLSHKNKSCVSYFADVADAVLKVLGNVEEDATADDDNNVGVVSQSTAGVACSLVVQNLDLIITQCSWVLDQFRADSSATSGTTADKNVSNKKQKELCKRLGHWVSACLPLLQTELPLGPLILSILRLVTHFFNFLSAFTKYEIALYTEQSGHICSYYEKVVKLCATSLTPKVYTFITYIESVQQKVSPKGKQKSETSKFSGESRAIPHLILAIEQYERCLLTLSKKSKVNLTDYLKRSTARDFRIIAENVKNALRGNDASDDENQEGDKSREAEKSAEENQPTQPFSDSVVTASGKPPTAKRGRKLGPNKGHRLGSR